MHFIFLMHIDRTHNTSHCLSESFILTKSRPGKERIFRIRDFNCNLILFTPFYIFADIHHKRKKAAYMSHHSRLFNPCIPGNSLPVHKDNSCQIHSLEFQKNLLLPILPIEKEFLSVPAFSPPATFSRTCIQISIMFVVAMRDADLFPSCIIKICSCHFLIRMIIFNRMNGQPPDTHR